MSEQGQVKIGREFFAKVKLDYNDWRWALVREFLQNCFDAPGCKRVEVGIADGGLQHGNTMLTVKNDGAPMDRETLVGKLLTLGGSGKNFEGECTGGFGVAKSLLYYAHLSYRINTGSLLVDGSGAQYSISETKDQLWGTESEVILEGDEIASIRDKVLRFAALAQWKGKLLLNSGEWLETNMHKGTRRRDLGWGTAYTNQSHQNLCVVRLNGQPMFTLWTAYKGCVLIELAGKAKDVLTSNRDGLVGKYASELGSFLTSIAVDKRSALREQKAEYRRWRGEKLKAEAAAPKAVEGIAALVNLAELAKQVTGGRETPAVAEQVASGGISMTVVSQQDEPTHVSLGSEFILKNTTGKEAPVRYTPGDSFSDYSSRLVKAWAGVLLKLHQLLNRSGEFSVGFVIDDESEAEHEQGPYGKVYYINPCKAVDGKLENRWTSAWRDRHELISVAAHEVVHGAYGLKQHDEDYAGVLTEVMAVALRHLPELEALCKPPAEPPTAPPFRRV